MEEEPTGEPITNETEPRPPIILTPPPLSQAQVEKIIKFAEAAEEMVEALGSLYGDYCKWVLRNIKPMLIPPLMPPGTQEPSTPPPTTSP